MMSGWSASGTFGLRWDTYTIGQSEAHPELVDRELADIAAERGAEPLDCLLDLALEEPGLGAAGAHRSSPTTTRPGSPISWSRSTARSASPTPARTRASCATRRRPPTCSATGCATRASCRWSRRSASSAASRPTSSASPTAATCGPGEWADVAVFDPATVAPGPVRRVRDFPADAERLTADQPVGMQHVVVNGTPIQVDGARTDAGNVGQVVRPSARP